MWRALEQEGDIPVARSSHTMTHLDQGICVVFGGEHMPREPVKNDTYVYNRSTRVWKRIDGESQLAPSERLGHVAASIGTVPTSMLLHGGRSHVNESSTLGDLYSFDLASGTWSLLNPTGKVPAARNFHASTSIGDCFYIFGGCSHEGRLSDLWRYDVRAGMWEEMAQHSTMLGRGGAGLVAVNEKQIYVLGGFTGKENGEIYRFDTSKNEWEQLDVQQTEKALFTPRSVFATAAHTIKGPSSRCCSHSDHIIVFGGEVDPSDLGHAGAGLFDNSTLCLDTQENSWHTIPGSATSSSPAPCARGWAASSRCEEGLLVHGGIDVTNTRLNDFYIFDLHH